MLFLTGINNSFVGSKYSHCLWYTKRKQLCFHCKTAHELTLSFFSVYKVTYIAKQFVPICFASSRLIRQIGKNETTEVIFCKHFIPFSYFTHPLFYKILQILYKSWDQCKINLQSPECVGRVLICLKKQILLTFCTKYMFICTKKSYYSATFGVQTVHTNWCVCVFHGI